MKLLLDTHMILWALTNDPQLSCKAREMISDPENVICCSTVSLWEIAIKNQKSPEKCPYHEKKILEYSSFTYTGHTEPADPGRKNVKHSGSV